MFLIALYYSIKGRDMPRTMFLTLCSIFLLIAFFLAWQEEYRERIKRQQEIAASKPDLKPEILQWMIAPVGDWSDSMVTIVGRITNLGSPGTVQEITIEVELGNSKTVRGTFPLTPTKDSMNRFGIDGTDRKIILKGSEHWLHTVTVEPIGTNIGRPGWASALFRGVTREQIQAATIVLTCTDAMGRKTWAKRRQSEGLGYELPLDWSDIKQAPPPTKKP